MILFWLFIIVSIHNGSMSLFLCSWLVTEQKEKLSELEQQLKKAEAAQRRRMQSEKAAREAEVRLHIII